MECPACHRPQPGTENLAPGEPGPQECAFCGVIFEKWYARQQKKDGAPAQPRPPAEKSGPPPAPEPPRPILESTSADVFAYRVDPGLRNLFGVLLVALDPALRWLHGALGERLGFSHYVSLSVLCLGAGTWIGLLARKRGYSDVLTPGGAGFLAGLLGSTLVLAIAPGDTLHKFEAGLPVFGIYSVYNLMGGLLAFFLRRFLKFELK